MAFSVKTDLILTDQFLGRICTVITEIGTSCFIQNIFFPGLLIFHDFRHKRKRNFFWFLNPIMTVCQLPFKGRRLLLNHHIFPVRQHDRGIKIIIFPIPCAALKGLFIPVCTP